MKRQQLARAGAAACLVAWLSAGLWFFRRKLAKKRMKRRNKRKLGPHSAGRREAVAYVALTEPTHIETVLPRQRAWTMAGKEDEDDDKEYAPPAGSVFETLHTELVQEKTLLDEQSVTSEQYSLALQEAIKTSLEQGEAGVAFVMHLHRIGLFDPLLQWTATMTSEEHRAAIHLIHLLVSSMPALHQLVLDLRDGLVSSLRFLIAVSPPPQCVRTRVKRLAVECSQELLKHHLTTPDQFKEPFYGPGLPPSNGFQQLLQLPAELDEKWASYWESANRVSQKWLGELDEQAENRRLKTDFAGWNVPGAIEDVTEWEMFRVIGDGHPPPKKFSKWGEVDGDDELLGVCIQESNKVLRRPREEGLCLDNIMSVHQCFNVDDDVEKAQYRQDVTVGSFHFYSQYRVFLPYQEIPEAMDHMLKTFNSPEMLAKHPILQAMYFYSAFVYFIHPFEDGNGRMARLVSNIILKKNGYEFALDYQDKVVTFKEYIKKVLDTRDV